jgi:hypothetical protein
LDGIVSVIIQPIGQGRWPSCSWPSSAALIIFDDQFKFRARLCVMIVHASLLKCDRCPK